MDLSLPSLQAQIGGTASTVANILIISILVISFLLIVAAIITFIVIFALFRKKAYYYEVYGADDSFNKETGELDTANISIGVQKKSKARFFSKSGITRMSLISPRKKTMPIPPNLIYQEGVYFLKIKNEFIAIPRPQLHQNGDLILNVQDAENWKVWNDYETEKIGKRFPERDAQIRIFVLFIVAIIFITVLSGFVLWLAYSNTGKIVKQVQTLSDTLSAIGTKTGINIPN